MKNLQEYLKESNIQKNSFLVNKKLNNKLFSNNKIIVENSSELQNIIFERLDDGITDFSDIDTSNVTNMDSLFYTNKFKSEMKSINVTGWNTSKVTSMEIMFNNCYLEEIIGIEDWDVSNVTSFYDMFSDCPYLKLDLKDWDVCSGIIFDSMFLDSPNINFDVSDWNMYNAVNISLMFSNCKSFEGKGLEEWRTPKLVNMYKAFDGCENMNADLSNWDVSNLKSLSGTFYNCYKLDFDLSKWKLENLKTCVSDPFRNCKSLSCDLSKWKYLEKIFELNKNSFHGCDKCKF